MDGFPRVALQTLAFGTLGIWLGAWLFFGGVVAPAAFQELPTELAGRIASRALTVLHLGGAAAGVLLAGLALALRRGRALISLPLLLTALLLYSHFGITAEMTEVRPFAVGEDATREGAARYNQLHGRSMILYTAIGVALLVLLPWHVRAQSRARPDDA